MKKKEPMKHRGIRFSENQWNDIEREAQDKGVNFSDIVRHSVDFYMECKDDLSEPAPDP